MIDQVEDNHKGGVPLKESVDYERESTGDEPESAEVLNNLGEAGSSEDELFLSHSQRSSSKRASSTSDEGFLYIIVSWLMTTVKFGKFTTSRNDLAKSNGRYSLKN